MADVRVKSTELMVGYNHATLTDTINRAFLIAHDSSGHHTTADFYAFSIHPNGTKTTGSSGTAGTCIDIKFSTNGILFNRGGFELSSTSVKMPSSGDYFIIGQARIAHNSSNVYASLAIYRNGSELKTGGIDHVAAPGTVICYVHSLVHCNSTTDVFSVKFWNDDGLATCSGSAVDTFFQGWKVGK